MFRDEALVVEDIKHFLDCGVMKCEGAGDHDCLEPSVWPCHGEDGS